MLNAIEYVYSLGAACVGTAGQPHKHSPLRATRIGELCSSRDGAAFVAGAVLLGTATPLHTMFNSLSFDFIKVLFALLCEGVDFEEIGKRGIWASGHHLASTPTTAYCEITINRSHDTTWIHHVLGLLAARVDASVVDGLSFHSFKMAT